MIPSIPRSITVVSSFLCFFASLNVSLGDTQPTPPNSEQANSKKAAKGGLSFVSDHIAVTVKPDAKLVSIPFEFENKTNRTISISRYDSACSCISARVIEPKGKMVYKPGEKGKIAVDFQLGSFSGKQVKTVMLWTTDDPPNKPSSILTTAITIPVLFEISPTTLVWNQHGPKTTKTITVKTHGKNSIHILSHFCTNPIFTYQIKTIRDGWEYEISATPKDLSSRGMGILKLTTDAKIPRYQRQMAFFSIAKPLTTKKK